MAAAQPGRDARLLRSRRRPPPANYQLIVLPAALTDALVAACGDLLEGEHVDRFPVDVL